MLLELPAEGIAVAFCCQVLEPLGVDDGGQALALPLLAGCTWVEAALPAPLDQLEAVLFVPVDAAPLDE